MNTEIGLKGPWLDLVNECKRLGPVWLYNRNQAASLANLRAIPRLEKQATENSAIAPGRDLMIDFGQWHHVRAHRRGIQREISVLGSAEQHRFGVRPANDGQHQQLKRIVERHYHEADKPPHCPNSEPSLAPWHEELQRRSGRLRELTIPYYPTPAQVEAMFQRVLESRCPLRVATMNQIAYLRCMICFHKILRRETRFQVESASAILEFDSIRAAAAWIVQEPSPRPNITQWSLEFYDLRGAFCLSLQAPNGDYEKLWQEAVADTIPC